MRMTIFLHFEDPYAIKVNVKIICFRLIKEFDREMKDEERGNPPEVNKQLNDEKQSMVSSLERLNILKLFIAVHICKKKIYFLFLR